VFGLWVALVGATLPEGPPVLIDPKAALEHAEEITQHGGPEGMLRGAEIAVLAGRSGKALEILERLELEIEDDATRVRRLRIELDALTAAGKGEAVERTANALAARPGWAAHAYTRMAQARSFERWSGASRFGATCYALAFGTLAIMAGRQLLKLRREIAIGALLVGAAIAIALLGSPLHARVLALLELSWLALGHAAVAAASRTMPVPRIRALVLATFSIGALGSLAATLIPLAFG
jgi:hypothetical protein